VKQSRSTSLMKSIISTVVGFGISLAAQWAILPILIGAPVPLHANLAFAAIMTVISIARGYALERVFEMLGWRIHVSPFVNAAIFERNRQVTAEGWCAEHDDMHSTGQLAAAGAAYALHAGTQSETVPHDWPWSDGWWKPDGFRRDLVKACALIMAEGDKFDRDRKRGRGR
jgi:hypothetical protein